MSETFAVYSILIVICNLSTKFDRHMYEGERAKEEDNGNRSRKKNRNNKNRSQNQFNFQTEKVKKNLHKNCCASSGIYRKVYLCREGIFRNS